MNYLETYKAAVESKRIKSLGAKYVEFKEAGHQIVGEFVRKIVVSGQKSGTTYNQYLFKTDEGLVKFAMGQQADSEAGAVFVEGGIYSITYCGKIKLAGGRSMNKFEVVEVEVEEGEQVGGESDVPI